MSKSHYQVIWSTTLEPGAIGNVATHRQWLTLSRLQESRELRRYRVRGIVSDHIPLVGTLDEVIRRPSYHNVLLPHGSLKPYLGQGKNKAFFFQLTPNRAGRLRYIEVEVECELPIDAFRLAREPLNQVLDALAWNWPSSLVLRRLTLLSPFNGQPLAHELILPFLQPLSIGPLGGIHQESLFAPYSALFREALCTTSPFYRLLCAFRLYEGVNSLRKTMREERDRWGITDMLPKDPSVDIDELRRIGINEESLIGLSTVNDLREKLKPHRDGIAHFLLNKDQSHVYLANTQSLIEYTIGSAVLLRYAWKATMDLKLYFGKHIESHLMIGSMLPTPENDAFTIRQKS